MTDPITISQESWESLNQLLWLAHQELSTREAEVSELKRQVDVMAIENGKVRRRENRIRNKVLGWAEEFLERDARAI